MLKKLKLQDIKNLIPGKRIFLRADFNTPLKSGKVANNLRIVETLPTIQRILESSPKGVVLASHLGRPDGYAKPEFSLQPVHAELESLLKTKVKFVKDCVGEEALTASNELKNGELLLLENLRFHPEEEGSYVNEKGEKVKMTSEQLSAFRKSLTRLADLYVNDAFGTSHRAHSSIVGINLPVRAAGLLMQKELEFFGRALEAPKRPVLVILGGAKVADKVPLIKNLLKFADDIMIGGGMAFSFLKQYKGMAIGDSLFDEKAAADVLGIIEEAQKKGVRLHLPVDFVCGRDLNSKQSDTHEVGESEGIEPGWKGLDIGEQSAKDFARVISQASTIIMNGPMGAFENEAFALGSRKVVEVMVKASKERGALTVVGGGDTVNMVEKVKGAKEALSHISTGGGASIELLEGKKLPGVEYLSNIDDLNAKK